MKCMTGTVIAAALAIVGLALADDETQNHQQQANPTAFLQQLVGEWTAVSYAVMDPAQEPYRFEGRETARMLGQ